MIVSTRAVTVGVGRIRRVAGQRAIQVVDLEEDALALNRERPEVVFAVARSSPGSKPSKAAIALRMAICRLAPRSIMPFITCRWGTGGS